MRIILISASSPSDRAAAATLHATSHQVLEASRQGGCPADGTGKASRAALYLSNGPVDPKASIAPGVAAFATVGDPTLSQYRGEITVKPTGHFELVHLGLTHVRDSSSKISHSVAEIKENQPLLYRRPKTPPWKRSSIVNITRAQVPTASKPRQ